MNICDSQPLSRIFILTSMVIVIVGAALSFAEWKSEKENWRGLTAFLKFRGATEAPYSISEPETTMPLGYRGLAKVNAG